MLSPLAMMQPLLFTLVDIFVDFFYTCFFWIILPTHPALTGFAVKPDISGCYHCTRQVFFFFLKVYHFKNIVREGVNPWGASLPTDGKWRGHNSVMFSFMLVVNSAS